MSALGQLKDHSTVIYACSLGYWESPSDPEHGERGNECKEQK
jgi:hypothetical protein